MKLARDGIREIALATLVLGGGAALCAAKAWPASPVLWLPAGLLTALWLFVLAFFRVPRRNIPSGPGLLISPADGRITEIAHLPAYDGFDGPAIRIGIFLSVFDVHVNRAPCDGSVIRTDYHPGEFLDARHPECGARNESNTIVIQPSDGPGPIIVRQIAGLIARRIVCHLRPGDGVRRGDLFGMIKFGSRTELIVPAEPGLEVRVNLDEQVRGGSTVLLARCAKPKLAETGRHAREAVATGASP